MKNLLAAPSISIQTMEDAWQLYREDLAQVEAQLRTTLASEVPLVNEVARHLLLSGGKRVRPLLLLMTARLCGPLTSETILLAALIEAVHNAALLHDDVIDEADIRRGVKAVRSVWGNQVSILIGDYLYSKAVLQAVSLKNQEINETLSEACRKMSEGEILQLSHHENWQVTEEQYLKIVEYKTGSLMAATCRLAGILHHASQEIKEALTFLGLHLGIAFQIADDTLDYTARQNRLGKTKGQDLKDGRITLPLLHLLSRCKESEREELEQRLQSQRLGDEDLTYILGRMKEFGSIAYAQSKARAHAGIAKKQLALFQDSPHRQCLSIMADYIVDRDH
jgi:octaprenyl-diphosphate synthase